MSSFADAFITPLTNCEEFYNQGSQLLVGPLPNCGDKEPPVATLTVGGTPAQGNTTLALTSDIDVTLRKGLILYFDPSDPIVVSATTKLTVAGGETSVPVEALGSNVPVANDIAQTWGLLSIQAPTDLPFTTDSASTDRTDLEDGIQGSEVKTSNTFSSQVSLIATKDDEAFWGHIQPAATGTQRVFVALAYSSGVVNWGPTIVMGLSYNGEIKEISRPNFTLNFQSGTAVPTLYEFQSTPQQTQFTEALKLMGLPDPSA